MSDYSNDDTGDTNPNKPKITNFAQTSDGVAPETDDSPVLRNDKPAPQSPPGGERIVTETPEAIQTQASAPGSIRTEPGQQQMQQPVSRAEFTTAFDIIDEMDKTLNEAKPVMFSSQMAKVDREQMSEYLEELKKVLPVQLERASALMRESERRLEAAQDQSESITRAARRNSEEIIAKANEQADFLSGHQNVVSLAEEKARVILADAQARADKVTQGADDYSSTMLSSLEAELEKLTRDVKGGLSILRTREQEASARLHRMNEEINEEN